MVAVVLLIAFTIGVGGLIFTFSTGLTTTSTGITSNQSEALARCANVRIDVYRITNTTVAYSNPSSQTITGLVILFGSSSGTYTGVTTPDVSLTSGESNVTYITNSTGEAILTTVATGIQPGGAAGNTSVIVRGQCQTLVLVQGKCTSSDACWDV